MASFRSFRGRPRPAASLVEALVAIGIIGLLLALLLPAVQRIREAAAKLQCQSNLRQIGIALHHYHATHGRLPPGPIRSRGNDPNWLLIWHALLLPYVEQDALWAQTEAACRADPRPYMNPPHVGLATVIPVYGCPADSRLSRPLTDSDGVTATYTSYLGISGAFLHPDGLFGHGNMGPGLRLTDATDGLSNTLLVGERPPPDTLQAGQWYSRMWPLSNRFGQLRGPEGHMRVVQAASGPDPCISGTGFQFGPGRTENPCDRYHFWSLHPGGANFLFGDGSIRFLQYSARPLLPALATRNGGEASLFPE